MTTRLRTAATTPAETIDRALARFHLDLAQALSERREALRVSIEDLSSRTGLAVDRLEMIEEGDTSSLTEIVVLCNALETVIKVDAAIGFELVPLAAKPRLVSALA